MNLRLNSWDKAWVEVNLILTWRGPVHWPPALPVSIKKTWWQVQNLREKFRRRRHLPRLQILARKLLRWCIDNKDACADYEPDYQDRLEDRDELNWTPLVSIASIASPELGRRMMNLAVSRCSAQEEADDDVLMRLINDQMLFSIFGQKCGRTKRYFFLRNFDFFDFFLQKSTFCQNIFDVFLHDKKSWDFFLTSISR